MLTLNFNGADTTVNVSKEELNYDDIVGEYGGEFFTKEFISLSELNLSNLRDFFDDITYIKVTPYNDEFNFDACLYIYNEDIYKETNVTSFLIENTHIPLYLLIINHLC